MKRLSFALAAASICLVPMTATAESEHAGHESMDHSQHAGHGEKIESRTVDAAADHEKARAYFTDTVLTAHTGEEVRFYSDVLEGKTVVVSFIFTSCVDACPLINQNLEKIQARLGERMGKDVMFVSISVDPETDTPDVLNTYSQEFNAGEGWLFLTGSTENVATVSSKLGQVFEKEEHLTALLIGNTETARWRKVPAYLPDNVITSQITDIADDNIG